MPERGDDTPTQVLLQRLAEGDERAGEELLSLLYRELHRIAHQLMRGERRDHTLQTTALIHEAWARLAGQDGAAYEDRGHFVRVAARAMRRVLVDHARARVAGKRRRDLAEPLEENALVYWDTGHEELLALDEALERLGERDADLLRIVELRFFGGLTLEETGQLLGRSVSQVHKGWTFARGWLRRELERGTDR